jgi:hypothetical protein
LKRNVVPVRIKGSIGHLKNQPNFLKSSLFQVNMLLYSTGNIRQVTSEIINESRLTFDNSSGEQIVISGASDIGNLRTLKNILLTLQGNWRLDGNNWVVSEGQKD